MKHVKLAVCIAVMIALLAGCASVSFVVTTAGNKVSVKVDDPDDGAYVETESFSFGKDQVVSVTSSLEDGELQIEFIEATVFTYADQTEDVTLGDTAVSVTVGPDDETEFDLPKGDYVIRVTASGSPSGKARIEIEKQE